MKEATISKGCKLPLDALKLLFVTRSNGIPYNRDTAKLRSN
jgi:hypothetical protein